jgi:hypothetical protein
MNGFISFRFVSLLLELVSFYAGAVKAEFGNDVKTGFARWAEGYQAEMSCPWKRASSIFPWIPSFEGMTESKRASGK